MVRMVNAAGEDCPATYIVVIQRLLCASGFRGKQLSLKRYLSQTPLPLVLGTVTVDCKGMHYRTSNVMTSKSIAWKRDVKEEQIDRCIPE